MPEIGYYIFDTAPEGPFPTKDDAIRQLSYFVHEWATPEHLNIIITYFDGKTLDLVKENGLPLNGYYLKDHPEIIHRTPLPKRRR